MKLMRRNYNYLPSILDEFLGKDLMETSSFRNTVPAVNIKETKEEFMIEMAAPGMEKKDFNLELNQDILTISYERKTENRKEEEGFTRKEFSISSFKRSFVMPEGVDGEKIKASYNNGILLLNIPKKEEAKPKEPKKITIS